MMLRALSKTASDALPRFAEYHGGHGRAWLIGGHPRAATIAAQCCGDDHALVRTGRIWRPRLPHAARSQATAGAIVVGRSVEPPEAAVVLPAMVHQRVALPDSIDALHAQIRTSTTREDLRRIRKAAFSFDISRDPDVVRVFYERFYVPLLDERYPDDASVSSPEALLTHLDNGGELIRAHQDGEWLAGFLNVAHESRYALNWMGVLDGRTDIRRSHVVAALYVRSMERGVELGTSHATFGRSLPFLDKGLIWFKAKWGGVIERDPKDRSTMWILADLQHATVQQMLADTPLLTLAGGSLRAVRWLENNPSSIKRAVKDTRHFAGVDQWVMLGTRDTLDTHADAFREIPGCTLIRMPDGPPCLLGDVLRDNAAPSHEAPRSIAA